MAKNTIADLDTTASNNTDVLGQSTSGTAAVSTIDTMIQNSLGLLARFYADIGGLGTVGGTADAITLTTASTYQALENGITLAFKAGSSITGASTINVDGLGAKAIRRLGDSATQAGDIVANGVYLLRYDTAYNAAAGAWIVLNSGGASAATTSAAGIVELATAQEALAASSSALALTPASIASLIQNINNNAFNIADLQGTRLNMAGGIADAYDSETDVDTATSTNESYDSGNDLYAPSTSGGGAISGGTGTNIGNMSPLSNAFNGVTNATNGGSAAISGTSGYVGKTYSGGKKIQKVDCHGSNNLGYHASDANFTLELYGKTGTAPSSATDGTLLATTGSINGALNESAARTLTSSDQTTTFDHVWVRISTASSDTLLIVEVVFYEMPTVNNMTLVSNAFTASAVPTQARVAVFIDPQVSITINTDFTAEVSRDGGTTWTAVTLALVSNPVGTVEQYEGTVSISSQPSGTSMKYRLKTLNNKDIDVTGIVFQWS